MLTYGEVRTDNSMYVHAARAAARHNLHGKVVWQNRKFLDGRVVVRGSLRAHRRGS